MCRFHFTPTGRSFRGYSIISSSPSCGFLSSLFMSSLEEEEGKSENHNEDDIAESHGERNGSVESAQTPTPSETAEDEERSETTQEEEQSVGTAEEEEDVEIKVCRKTQLGSA